MPISEQTGTALLGLLMLGVVFLIALPPYWKIFKKAGFSPWLSLLMVIPLVNLVVLYYIAFSKWRTARSPDG